MDEGNQNSQQNAEEPKPKIEPEIISEPKIIEKSQRKNFGKYSIVVLICLVLMSGSAYGAFYWRDSIAKDTESKNQQEISLLESRITELTQKTDNEDDSDEICESIQPTALAVENIIASIKTANTQSLEGYMADTVNVILAATEAYGPQTKSEAVSHVTDFIGDPTTTTWDFNLPVSTLNSYATSDYGDYFVTIDTIGRSSDGKIISFTFDCNGKINQVFLSNSEEIIIGN